MHAHTVVSASRLLTVSMAVLGYSVLALEPAQAKDGKEMLVPVMIDGKPSAILQKVIVINKNARLLESPGSRNNSRLKPCQIFYRMKADDGSLEVQSGTNTFWRVGDSEGNEKGWIDKAFLTVWNTRFVLDPLGVASQDKPFKLFDAKSHEEMAKIEAGVGEYSLAFVMDKPQDDEEFPVGVYIGPISEAADESDEDSLGIDIAFVVEMTDFAFFKWDDGRQSADLLQEVITKFVEVANARASVKGRVRCAVVQYQDTAGVEDDGPLFIARLVSDFTSSETDLRSAMRGLSPKKIGGDWPEDGLAGIALALDGLKWKPHSTKHVVLLGAGPLQDKAKGLQVSMFKGTENNSLTTPKDGVRRNGYITYGWSSTGLDIKGITAKANEARNTSASGVDVLKGIKTLHAVLLGKPAEPMDQEVEPILDRLLDLTDEQLEEEINGRPNPAAFLDALVFFAIQRLAINSRKDAEKQYRQLSENGGGLPGIYFAAPPTREGTDQAARLLLDKVAQAFEDMEAAFGGAEVRTTNEFSQSLVTIAQKYREQYKEKTVMSGLAYTRNDDGKEVAKLKVLVYRHEVERLKSTLDSILKNFESMDAKKKKDVGETLETLQRAIAGGAAGQAFDEKTTLASVIGDLPMKTPVLATTAKAIASMSSDEFTDWMDQLRFGISRCDALLKSQFKADFAFLEQSQLP